jgi:hypothetical protein
MTLTMKRRIVMQLLAAIGFIVGMLIGPVLR